MTLNMIVFEYRDVEKNFFANNKFENFNITFYPECLTPEFVETIPEEVLDNTNVISVFINSVVDEKVINSFKNLRIISTRSTGYDHIDLNTCKNKNIAVVNVENYGATSVAQFTFGLIVLLLRKVFPAVMYVKELINTETDYNGRDMSKLTLGVVGTGAIGASVCRLAKCFNMNLLAYDVYEKRELDDELGLKYVSLEDLLANSDIVTLHLPYTGQNYHMFSADQFHKMKEGAYFINTSRGEIVDLPALYTYIENGKLGGVALDVLTCESMSFSCDRLAAQLELQSLECVNEMKYVKKLSAYNNVIITPHIAYATLDSIDYILEVSMRSIADVIYGGKSSRVV